MPRFNWDPKLDTGIEELDIQHRRFVLLINHLDAAAQADPVLAELLRHLVFHFRCEQALIDTYEVDYAALEESEHSEEEGAVRGLIGRFRAGEIARAELCDRLYAFLVDHVINRDQVVASAVIAKRESV